MKARTHWQRPQHDFYKVNVDAAFNADEKNGASGVIIRDDQGHIVAASSTWHEYVPDALTAEAYACWDGVKLMKFWNVRQAVLETESMEFVSLWKSTIELVSYRL